MKSIATLSTVILVLTLTESVQGRIVTLWVGGTNQSSEIVVESYESFRIVSALDPASAFSLGIRRGGDSYRMNAVDLAGFFSAPPNPVIIPPKPVSMAGPVTLTLESNINRAQTQPAFVTIDITPDSYPPDKALTVPSGAGGASVTLECSTDLVHWIAATNGVYIDLPAAKFFRIKAERVPQ